ncbi:hypothetical protein JTB14_010469 [Gonioctena quinquepunctata]|nr:hypothetical protein JTB14_010469 [Gonioctena quinquepunctata]
MEEQNFMTKLQTQIETIERLKKEITEKYSEITKLKEGKQRSEEVCNIANKLLDEMKEINLKMVEAIRTLEKDNQTCDDELYEICKTDSLYEKNDRVKTEEERKVHRRVEENGKILVYGDGSGKGLAAALGELIDKNLYQVTGIVKSGASVEDISRCIHNSIKKYSTNDFVVVTLNFNFVEKISRYSLEILASLSKYRNLIICIKSAIQREIINEISNYFKKYPANNDVNITMTLNNKLNSKYEFSKFSLCRSIVKCIPVLYNQSDTLVGTTSELTKNRDVSYFT